MQKVSSSKKCRVQNFLLGNFQCQKFQFPKISGFKTLDFEIFRVLQFGLWVPLGRPKGPNVRTFGAPWAKKKFWSFFWMIFSEFRDDQGCIQSFLGCRFRICYPFFPAKTISKEKLRKLIFSKVFLKKTISKTFFAGRYLCQGMPGGHI